MMVAKVWMVFVVAVLLVTVLTSKQVAGTGINQPQEEVPRIGSLGHHLTYKGNFKQALPFGLSNRSEFGGLPAESFQDVEKKMLSQSFTQILFQDTSNKFILEKVTKSAFYAKMASGTLPVEQYRRYMIQDAVYLYNGATLYAKAAQKMQTDQRQWMQDPKIFHVVEFYWKQAKKFEGYYKDFLKIWQLKDVDKIETGAAVEMYMGYQQAVVNENPMNLAIAMLPCSMLYPYLAKTGVESGNEMKNPYYNDWFKVNIREGESSTEKFVNQYLADGEYKEMLNIFLNGMLGELNFFLEAGGQPLLSLPDATRNVD